MLIDMHAHSKGISRCCRADAMEVINTAKKTGIDGLILCNHYDADDIAEKGLSPREFAQNYIDEFHYAERCAREAGVKLFFGVEITARKLSRSHILVYGMPPEFTLEHPEMYDYTLEQLYSIVHERGGLLIQAHPFRGKGKVQDLNCLDAVEINCHPLYDATHCYRLMDIARNAGKFVTCGGDYHADTYRAVCGTYFPDSVETAADIVGYLKETRTIKLHVHELRTDFHRDITYYKP